ncbi:thiol-activated cytolysin family protein [Maribacter sp. CXY002]|uniref:thiol-activated cytolysin family protein n=1 Tax=Maribacter luteocoastalis TaxID=3407671 RepID=UPI003B66F737
MKTNQFIFKILSLAVLLILLLVSCSSDSDNPEIPTADNPIGQDDGDPSSILTIDQVLARAVVNDFPQTQTADTLEVSEQYSEDYRSLDDDTETLRFRCKTKKVSVEDGNGEFPLFNPTAEIIWPGNLLQGKTLGQATPSSINVDRAGNTISYNLVNGNSVSAQTVDEITKGNVQTAMNAIIEGDPNIVPANFVLEVEEVFSEEQMAFAMGISYESYKAKAQANLSFSSEQQYNRVLVKLTQEYYTMSMDQVNGNEDIFAPNVTGEDLDPFVQADNPATYISSVTYGRIFYMLVESTSSRSDLISRIEGTYKGFGNKVEGEVDYEEYNTLDEVKTKIIAYGGSVQSAFELVGELDIVTIGEKLAESTDIRTGQPLSYVVRSVAEPDKVVGTKLATAYDRVECNLQGVLPPVAFEVLVDLFDDGIGAATQLHGRYVALFNKAGNQYYIYNFGSADVEGPYNINDASAPLGASGFDKVGAAVRAFLTKIYIFNEDGTRFEIIDYDSAQSGFPNGPIGAYIQQNGANRQYLTDDVFTENQLIGDPVTFTTIDCNTYAFVSKGIQAAARRSVVDVNISSGPIPNTATRTRTYFWSLNSNGTSYARSDYYGSNTSINSGQDFRCWADEKSVSDVDDFRLERVEAACKVELNDTDFILYFSSDGKMSRQNLNTNEQEGPWAIN